MTPPRENAEMDRAGTKSAEYLMLDSCVVAAYYVPRSAARFRHLANRAKLLMDSTKHDLPICRRLLIPNICIGEVFSTFAKYRFASWNPQVPTPIGDVTYWRARQDFHNDIHNGRMLQQYELSRYHVLACDLISPVDHAYEFYRSRGKKKRKIPMGAFDHLFIAIGIELVKTRGWDNVLLVTADRRLGHILTRASKLTRTKAARLGLLKTASDLGLEFGPRLYPRVLNLATCTERELCESFAQWPPISGPAADRAPRPRLTDPQRQVLVRLYRRLTDESADSLSYSEEFEIIYDAFIAETGLEMTRHWVWTELVNLRKRRMLPTAGERKRSRRRSNPSST